MKTDFAEMIRSVSILAYGVFSASYVLSDRSTDFESIVAIGLFLILNRLEFTRDSL